MTDLAAPMSPDDVKANRMAMGLSQRDLAGWLGLSGNGERTIRGWEKGEGGITGPARVAIRLGLRWIDSGQALPW